MPLKYFWFVFFAEKINKIFKKAIFFRKIAIFLVIGTAIAIVKKEIPEMDNSFFSLFFLMAAGAKGKSPKGGETSSRSREKTTNSPISSQNYYQRLGLQKNASEEEIKGAYRKLAFEHHPDKGGDPKKFKKIDEAFQALKDSEKRKTYDKNIERETSQKYEKPKNNFREEIKTKDKPKRESGRSPKSESRKFDRMGRMLPKEEEETEEETIRETSDGAWDLISPEGVLMFFIAGVLDSVGLVFFVLSFFGIGIPLSFVLDILGFIIIGGWIFIRTGQIKTTKKTAEAAKKIAKKAGKRFGITFLVELIPFLGDISPSWLILVFFELKNGRKG